MGDDRNGDRMAGIRRAAVTRSITRTYLNRFDVVRAEAAESGVELLPVTGAQRRFHHTSRVDMRARRAVVSIFNAFPAGSVSVSALNRAARTVARRNPVLRARVAVHRGLPVQCVSAPEAVNEQVAVEKVRVDDARRRVRGAVDDWPAAAGPFRLVLVRDATTDLLAIALDHTVCDEFSVGQVIEQLGAAYHTDPREPYGEDTMEGSSLELERYREAVYRQLDREDQASGPDALAHWTRRVSQAGQGHWGQGRPLNEEGSRSLSSRIAMPASGRGRIFPVLLAACQTAVADHEDAAPVCYAWGGRGDQPETGSGPVLGCFINTVPACRPGEASDSFMDTLIGWWDDLQWVDTPYDEVVRAARLARMRWTGHLDLMLTLIDRSRRAALALGGQVGVETYVPGMRVHAPVNVVASYNAAGLLLRIDHDRELVSDEKADRLLAALAGAVGERLAVSS
jgi:hypothetical protein